MFNRDDSDGGLSIILKREVNNKMSSLHNYNEIKATQLKYEEVLRVIKSIEATEPQSDEDIDFILNTINTIWKKGILFPLTLTDDEFFSDAIDGYKDNKRYYYIKKTSDNRIINTKAYKVYVRALYKHNTKEQESIVPYVTESNPKLYISKGGIVTGEYIHECYIRDNIINQHNFTIQSTPIIPACIIQNNNEHIYVVDHREPKLKILKEFYEVPTKQNEYVANNKYNIRTYKKL